MPPNTEIDHIKYFFKKTYVKIFSMNILKNYPLPSLLTRFSRIKISFLIITLFFSLYYLSSFYSLGEPQLVPKTFFDELLHFNPHWIFVYLTSYVVPLTCFSNVFKKNSTERFIYSFIILILTTSIIFFIFPTYVPRENYPMTENEFFLTQIFMNMMRSTDVATNCFPSFHVSSGVLFSFFTLHSQWKYWPMSFLWSFLVILSTLYTKQHYAIDCFGGAILGTVVYLIIFRKIYVKS